MSVKILRFAGSTFLFTSLLFFSCQKEVSNTKEETADDSALEIGMTHDAGHTVLEQQNFSAIANVTGCIGYNIRFYGLVDYKINKVYDQNGNLAHFTRHWSIKGLEAERVGMTSVKFDVVAGAEMFSIKDPVLNAAGTGPTPGPAQGTVFIHQGTIVLENRDTHERLVIRHQILKVPGQAGVFRSGWFIKGKKCGSEFLNRSRSCRFSY